MENESENSDDGKPEKPSTSSDADARWWHRTAGGPGAAKPRAATVHSRYMEAEHPEKFVIFIDGQQSRGAFLARTLESLATRLQAVCEAWRLFAASRHEVKVVWSW